MASSFKLTHKPCNLDYCSSGYGTRKINVNGASTYHRGFDIPASGSAYAMAKGKVKEVGWNDFRGWYIVISHGNVWSTEYQHLAYKPSLKKGKSVKSGQKIGTIGATGVGARHLHIEVRKYGNPVNPQPYLIKSFLPKKITHVLQQITGYNHRALAWRWYLDVARLQKDLKKLGFYTGNVDGKFESNTAKAVKKFQRKQKLTPDGSVGTKTRKALEEALKDKTNSDKLALESYFFVKTLYNMNIRKEPNKTSKVLKMVKKGSKIKISKTAKLGKWGYSKTLKGWICIDDGKKAYCKAM